MKKLFLGLILVIVIGVCFIGCSSEETVEKVTINANIQEMLDFYNGEDSPYPDGKWKYEKVDGVYSFVMYPNVEENQRWIDYKSATALNKSINGEEIARDTHADITNIFVSYADYMATYIGDENARLAIRRTSDDSDNMYWIIVDKDEVVYDGLFE